MNTVRPYQKARSAIANTRGQSTRDTWWALYVPMPILKALYHITPEPCAGRRFGRSHTNSMLTARRSSPVQCAIIRGKGARLTNEKDRGQDADRSGMIGKHRCRARGSPNFCARHAACIVRSSRNDALHAASGIRTYHCRSNICPSGTFRVGLTVSLAVLNVIDSDVETKVITTPSIFAVLSLTHLGCGGGMSRCARCSHRGALSGLVDEIER